MWRRREEEEAWVVVCRNVFAAKSSSQRHLVSHYLVPGLLTQADECCSCFLSKLAMLPWLFGNTVLANVSRGGVQGP